MLVDVLLRHRLDIPRAQVLVHALLQPHALKNASHAERLLQSMDPPPCRYFQALVTLVVAAAVAVVANLVAELAPEDVVGFVENSLVVFREHRSLARRTASPSRWAFAAVGRSFHVDKEKIFTGAFVEALMKPPKQEEEEAVGRDSGRLDISAS